MRQLRSLADIGSAILVGGVGIALVLGGVGVLSFGSLWTYFDAFPGTLFLILAGACLLLVAARFVLHLVNDYRNAVLFSHDGEWGRIELSPQAVREFISDILRQQVGIERFRIVLKHHADGVAITVRTALTPDQRVTDMGVRIQRELAQHVTERTGVEVREVTVLVRSIRREETAPADTGSSDSAPAVTEAVIDADRVER